MSVSAALQIRPQKLLVLIERTLLAFLPTLTYRSYEANIDNLKAIPPTHTHP